MAVAVIMYVLVRWSRNEPAVSIGSVLAGGFVIGVIALADRGRTAEVARGFAWLFFAVVAYNFIPAITTAMQNAFSNTKTNVRDTIL